LDTLGGRGGWRGPLTPTITPTKGPDKKETLSSPKKEGGITD